MTETIGAIQQNAERLEVIAMKNVELSVMVTGVADCADSLKLLIESYGV